MIFTTRVISVMCIESPRGPCDLLLDEITTDSTLKSFSDSIPARFEISKLSLRRTTLSFENGHIVRPFSSMSETRILRYGPSRGITCRVYRGEASMCLFCPHILTGKTIQFMVEPSYCIGVLKLMIQEMMELPSTDIRILHAGNELSDGHMVSDSYSWSIAPESILILFAHMPGVKMPQNGALPAVV